MEKISYVTYKKDEQAEAKIKERNVLFIDNDVAQQLLSMDDCLRIIEEAYREFGLERATASRAAHHVPRPEGAGWYRWAPMAAAIAKLGVLAIRIKSDVNRHVEGRSESYCVMPGKYCGLILLFSTEDGAPLAILNEGHIQHMRVGATGGLSAKYMACQNASTLGIFGSGGMASTHAWAIAKVRPIKKIKVYSPNRDHREAFAHQMSGDLGIEVRAVDEPVDVAQGSDIVTSCTNSQSPVIKAEWLEPGMHVLSVSPEELDDDVFRRSHRYVYSRTPTTEHYVAAPRGGLPSGMEDYLGDIWIEREARLIPEQKKTSLSDLVLRKAVGRADNREITCFASQGNPIQFAASAYKVYQLAKEKGLGRKLPLAWFLQDIKS